MTISIIIGAEQQTSITARLQVANRILDVLESYRLRHRDGTSDRNDEGRKRFLPIVMRKVEYFQPIHMVLPAFPFKSPNNDSKVLGTIPDKGEEIALAHLDGLCKSIEDIYNPGAQVTIASDGIVYNDLLGVSDRDVWIYGQTLRKISESSGFNHIRFIPLRDLLGLDLSEPVSEETYVAQAQNFRDKMSQLYTPAGFDIRQEILKNEDAAATYRGYIKFLSKDLANTKTYETKISKSAIKKRNEVVARKMMARGKAFAAAVQTNLKDYVRLSIHPSSGSTKFSIALFPHTSHNMTPWHATTLYGLNGSVTTAHLDSLKTSTSHELVFKGGAPWYYRERSDLYHWSDIRISFEHLYPTGLLITPVPGFDIRSFSSIDATKLRCLAEQNSPVILRGFTKMDIRVVINEVAEPVPISECHGLDFQSSK
ncbi:hypothetical protein P167DRAFT_484328 [Morchella conica CCBAS932]|uniref:Pyoverdine/dityrosine biosynthesis protein n=1 Tax=Morchella conica CCBAS932 TaxID=1392247 RepID=A0A3N4L1Y3_9PEZI|nr:hypothetical protein P167DRAFT_484328 [Morchella conica CCBAS932]